MLQEVIKLSEDEDVPACLPCTSAGLNVNPGAGAVSRRGAHYITTELIGNRCCFKGPEITEGKKGVMGDGHGERVGCCLRGCIPLHLQIFLFALFPLGVCICEHVCKCVQLQKIK